MSYQEKYLKYKNKYLSLKKSLSFSQYGKGVNNELVKEELYKAIYRNDVNRIKELCNKDVVNDASDITGFTHLMYASYHGNLEMVKALCDCGSNLDASLNHNKQTSLMLASQQGHLNIVIELCNRGANINAKDTRQETAILLAWGKGKYEIVKELISRGAPQPPYYFPKK
jgi:ankyrin repeat protein